MGIAWFKAGGYRVDQERLFKSKGREWRKHQIDLVQLDLPKQTETGIYLNESGRCLP